MNTIFIYEKCELVKPTFIDNHGSGVFMGRIVDLKTKPETFKGDLYLDGDTILIKYGAEPEEYNSFTISHMYLALYGEMRKDSLIKIAFDYLFDEGYIRFTRIK